MQGRRNKRKSIVSTAEELFVRHGSKRVTVEEICREASVSKVTFYKHFKNKVDLVRSIRDLYIEEGFAAFDAIKKLDIPFAEKINLMTRWRVEHASRINAAFIRELINNDDVAEDLKRRFLDNIREAQATGEVRSDIDLDLLWLVLDRIGDIARDGSWQRVCSSLGEFDKQVRTLVFYGLLSR